MGASAFSFDRAVVAAVTPAEITSGSGPRGTYISLNNAIVRKANGRTVRRNVVAFGCARADIESKLQVGHPLNLLIKYRRGFILALGLATNDLPGPKPAPSHQVRRSRMSKSLLKACIDAAGFHEHRTYGDYSASDCA